MKSKYSVSLLILICVFAITEALQAQKSGTRMLKKAYKQNSTVLLDQFFRKWQVAVPTITDKELATFSDTIQEVYKVFTAFYKPTQLDRIGGSEWGNDVYQKAKYLIVQNELEIYFTDTIIYYSKEKIDSLVYQEVLLAYKDDTAKVNTFIHDERWKKSNVWTQEYSNFNWTSIENKWPTDTIRNFRPSIDCDSKIPLYYHIDFFSNIYLFLKDQHYPLGFNGISSPAHAKEESEKKQQFLENSIKIFYGHWGGYWQLHSYPTAYYVIFDKNMQRAVIEFRMIYEGGAVLLEKKNGRWMIINAKRTWIE